MLALASALLVVVAVAIAGMIFLALAAMAPEINAWPLPIALVLGLAVATAGFVIAHREPRRRVPLIVSAVAGTLHALGLLGIGAFGAHATFNSVELRFSMPDGYMGEVYVVYDMADGVPELRSTRGAITYDIPLSGLLATQASHGAGGSATNTSIARAMVH